MNKIIINFVVLVLLFSFNACDSSIIDLNPIGDTEAGFYQNEDQMEQAVLGIYQKLSFFYAFRGGQNNHLLPVTMLPGDDLTTSASYPHENFIGLNGSNSQLGLYYQYAYQLIARANTVLQKIEENGENIYKSHPEQLNYNKGEALFLRAYMYFNLWNVYGTAPLVTERITNLDNAYPPNSSGTELLDQAIIDLEQASQLLPASWPAAYKGRVVKNAAHGLRGKCLVFRGTVNKTSSDFTSAIADFNAITGVNLTVPYGNNFDVKFENNEESLFEYQANRSPANVNPWVGGGNDSFSVIGEIGAYWGVFNRLPTWIGASHFTATASIKSAYEDGDPRKTYNIDPNPDNVVNVKKYIRGIQYATGGQSNGISINNPRILRYADVLLLKAEAIVRSNGNLSEAIGLINQVRERARKSTDDGVPALVPADRTLAETNGNTVLDWVFHERRLELAFEEGHRWWDLRRRHISGEIDLKTHDFSSLLNDLKFNDHNINFPLPTGEVIDSPNLDQNTGY